MNIKDYRELVWSFSSNSSGGQYLKSEKVISGKKYYFKISDFRYGIFFSHEAVLEVIASRLGNLLELPVLKYTGNTAKIRINDKEYTTFVSKSLNYCKAGQTAIPLVTDYMTNKINNETPLAYCQRIDLTGFIDNIFIFDYLIMNVDRHGRNIELLYDGNIAIPAPIFDNGRSLTFDYGNRIENILHWNYTESGTGNNFVGGIYLENNLKHISKAYHLPILSEAGYQHIFYGLHDVLDKQHIKILKETIAYRYQVLKNKGVIV
ncbi:MAG: hypothetical protein V3G42_14210 [Oscillospiraceae bacterium]